MGVCRQVTKKIGRDCVATFITITSGWVNDMKMSPGIEYGDVFYYFVLSQGVDGLAMRNYKATEAYQYLHSFKVGRVLLRTEGEFIYLKADVNPSQASCQNHSAWVLVSSSGLVETTGCSCIAGLRRSCSHAASILWKVRLVLNMPIILYFHDFIIAKFHCLICVCGIGYSFWTTS